MTVKTTFRISLFQLLALALGLVTLVVLIPIGVQATASDVVIADPVSPTDRARVFQGRLEVEPVGGPVLTVPGRPFGRFGNPIHAFAKAFKYPAPLKLSGLDGTAGTRRTQYFTASLTVANETADPATVDLVAVGVGSSATTCPASVSLGSRTPMTEVVVPPGETLHTTYPEAMRGQLSTDGCLWAIVTGPTDGVVAVTFDGYSIVDG
jgi:hypothetical protein